MEQSVEIQARFINLDQKTTEKKLKEIGARKVGESFFREWIFGYKDWFTNHKRLRIRDDGKTIWLTYKANATWEVDSTEEVEITVSSAEDTRKLIEKIGVPLQRYQEKKRIKYKLGEASIDLDFWPQIPMVLEIEAPSKEGIMHVTNLLGLNWEDAIFIDQKVVHKTYYGIDLNEMQEYRF